MPRYAEFNSCCALVQWWAFACRMYKVPEGLLFHVPNQSVGGPRRGMNLKRMGVRSGTPDYMLAVPRGTYHGLFLEIKSLDGRVSPEQKETMQVLQSNGYAVAVCRSTDAARTIIESYLSS